MLCEGGPSLLHAGLTAGVVDELDLSIAPALVGGQARLLGAALPDVVRAELRQLLEEDGDALRPLRGRPLGARRPVLHLCAACSAAIVSSTLSRTVVSRFVTAPPLPMASATAAIDTLSGASHRVTPSCEPNAYQKPWSFPPTDSM